MGILKSKDNKAILYPTNLVLFSTITEKLFEEVEDHALTGSKLSKQKIQLTSKKYNL